MRRPASIAAVLCVMWLAGGAQTRHESSRAKIVSARSAGFPKTVRVRLWYLHPPNLLKVRAEGSQASARRCPKCELTPVTDLSLRAVQSRIQMEGDKASTTDVQFSGKYTISADKQPPIRADFPVVISAEDGHLLVTATLDMEEYVAGVLAGEVANFKSDEALKAVAVAARTFALHFGSRHTLEGFEFCDTTHCQDLRVAGIDGRLRKVAEATSGEVLWYGGEPAATYYHANCGGVTEDGQYTLRKNEAAAPYLTQHSDKYCVRNGGSQWHSEIGKQELQTALQAEGIEVPGTLRSLAVMQRTPSGRVESLRATGSSAVTVPGPALRLAIGRNLGWDRLKSNWYEVSVSGDRIEFRGRGSGHGVGLCQTGADVMGSEGKSYREILAYYYPGTKLGVAAQGVNWQLVANAEIEVMTTRPDTDSSLLPLATRMLHEIETSAGLTYNSKPRIKVFPSLAMFRNATGEPGWIAATTRGRTISMQPAEVLQQAGTLQATLKHELLHMLIESHAKPGTPVWFREGTVLYLTEPGNSADRITSTTAELEQAIEKPADEAALRRAYAQAQRRVAQLVQEHGRETVLHWVQEGLPAQFAD